MLPFTTVGNYELRFDRYNYLSIIGMSIFLIEIFKKYFKTITPNVSFLCLIIIGSIYGYLSHSRAENWKDSNSIWSDGIKKYPTNYLSYYNKALVEEKISGPESALELYQKSLSYKPDYYPSYVNIGSIYFNRNNYDLAYTMFEKASIIDSNFKEITNSMANCALKLNHLDTAKNLCNKLITKFPEYIDPYIIKATLLNMSTKYNEALKIISEAEKINPNNYGILFQKAFAYTNLLDYKLALEIYKTAETIDTTDAYLYLNKAILYNHLQKQDSACLDMKKAYYKGAKEAELYVQDCL